MLVVAVQHERRPGEESAGDVPAFPAVEYRLIPGNRTGVGLVRIDQQARSSVRRAQRRYRDSIRPDR